MDQRRIHYTTTTDGVTLGGTVHGEGPPLVLLQGIIGDGDLDWGRLMTHLTDRFTCHLPSLRGRGLSSAHADLSPRRLVSDVVTYVHSLAEPVALVGWSSGAELALSAAAAQPDAVHAVALVEPVVPSLMDEQEQAALGTSAARAGELAAEGRMPEAARAFAGWPFTGDDLAAAEDAGYFEASGRYVPDLLRLLQLLQHEKPTVDDPAALGTISTPVLVLHGSRTKPFFIAGARRVADALPHGRVGEIAGAGHAAPLTHPAALAGAVTGFLSPTRQPA